MKKILTIILSVLITLVLIPVCVNSNRINAEANDQPLTFTANEAGSKILLSKTGSPSWTGEYSLDGNKWNAYVPNSTGEIILNNVGDKVYFRGNYTASNDEDNYLKFVMNKGSLSASGNVLSLCNSTNFSSITTIPYDYMFYKLFYECTALTTAPILSAEVLSSHCYDHMFYYSGITSSPSLPATSLADYCYYMMFKKCIYLETVPYLPATTLKPYCYFEMFYDCFRIKLIESETPSLLYRDKFRIDAYSSGYCDLFDMFKNTGGEFTGTPKPYTTYYAYRKKITQKLTFAESEVKTTYGGSPFINTLSGAQTTVTYSCNNDDVAEINANTGEVTIKNVGIATITASAIEDEEHYESAKSYKLIVNKVQVDLPEIKTDLVYNREIQTGIVLPDYSSSLYTVTGDVSGKDAANYSATLSLNDKASYEWKISSPTSEDQTITWSIAQKELAVLGTRVANKKFDGTAIATVSTLGTLSGVITGDNVTLKVKQATFNDEKVGNDKPVTVKYEIEGTSVSNYKTPNDDTLSASITEANTNANTPLASLVDDLIDASKKDSYEMPYDAIKGFNATVVSGNTSVITAHIANGSLSSNVVVSENGRELPAGSFTITSGSVKVNFQPSYLNSLSEGEHKLTIVVDGTEYNVTITINKPTPTSSYVPVNTSCK